MILLITLLTSCQSTKQYIPYPDMPVLDWYVVNDDGTVTVQNSYIVSLAEFKIKYDELKELYDGCESIK